MEDEELETTDSQYETSESHDEISESQEETTEVIVDESTKTPPEKEEQKFSQKEVNEIVENRLNRERKRIEREYKENVAKYEELAFLTQQGLKANDLDETLDKSREFYGKQGIKYAPSNDSDETILGKAYANEIIADSESIDDLEKVVNKLTKKSNLNLKERVLLDSLKSEINDRKRITELKSIGVNDDELNSKDFKAFESQFLKDTPIKKIYELYKLTNTVPQTVENPGSMKTTPGKEKINYISEADFDKMTEKEIKENMDLIRDSMQKW